ncbi:hypothetical protein JFU04_07570 [Pseudomonas sp. TH21]|uniref:hypothetical protein n=1 Tax=Pseudomonas sp. TH21 TaxID=2796387 RepID=UPI001912B103|nr:hypothetical protein [Pseudomonas sp. TH21]MBK5475961.1 hypothetical protein [Pseudomonas sp. TH21]
MQDSGIDKLMNSSLFINAEEPECPAESKARSDSFFGWTATLVEGYLSGNDHTYTDTGTTPETRQTAYRLATDHAAFNTRPTTNSRTKKTAYAIFGETIKPIRDQQANQR